MRALGALAAVVFLAWGSIQCLDASVVSPQEAGLALQATGSAESVSLINDSESPAGRGLEALRFWAQVGGSDPLALRVLPWGLVLTSALLLWWALGGGAAVLCALLATMLGLLLAIPHAFHPAILGVLPVALALNGGLVARTSPICGGLLGFLGTLGALALGWPAGATAGAAAIMSWLLAPPLAAQSRFPASQDPEHDPHAPTFTRLWAVLLGVVGAGLVALQLLHWDLRRVPLSLGGNTATDAVAHFPVILIAIPIALLFGLVVSVYKSTEKEDRVRRHVTALAALVLAGIPVIVAFRNTGDSVHYASLYPLIAVVLAGLIRRMTSGWAWPLVLILMGIVGFRSWQIQSEAPNLDHVTAPLKAAGDPTLRGGRLILHGEDRLQLMYYAQRGLAPLVPVILCPEDGELDQILKDLVDLMGPSARTSGILMHPPTSPNAPWVEKAQRNSVQHLIAEK